MKTATLRQDLARATELQRRGQSAEAIALYRRVLKTNDRLAPAHYNLALLLKGQGQFAAAEKAFKAALKHQPDHRRAWTGYCRLLLQRNRHMEALRLGTAWTKRHGQAAEAVQDLIDLITEMGEVDLGSAGDEIFKACLPRPDLDCSGVILALLACLHRRPALRPLLSPGCNRDSTAAALARPGVLDAVLDDLRDELVSAAFAHMILPTREVEFLLAACQERLCDPARPPLPDNRIEAVAALALQMDLREYPLAVQESGPSASGPSASGTPATLAVAALARPLTTGEATTALESLSAALADLPWTRLLLTRQGPDKVREGQLAAAMPGLSAEGSPPAESVSAQVREQYEESPYPRWHGLRHGKRRSLAALVRELFPGVPVPPADTIPEILVAGCGTGRHALRTAIRIEGATVTAIDLSRSSLAYGQRQAALLGVGNVRFAQADIARLPRDLGQFDLIECCGVLHHMADPEQAWKGLLSHLKSNGLIKIALYSELARGDVAAVHRKVGDSLADLDLDAMRAWRQELLKLPESDPAYPVTRELDFYSLSGCRDFLFNRQEQRFTIARLQEALAGLDLEFLGFEFVDSRILAFYRRQYPSDPLGRDLNNWTVFEETHPAFFRRMYQFWCRRRGTANPGGGP